MFILAKNKNAWGSSDNLRKWNMLGTSNNAVMVVNNWTLVTGIVIGTATPLIFFMLDRGLQEKIQPIREMQENNNLSTANNHFFGINLFIPYSYLLLNDSINSSVSVTMVTILHLL